MRKSIAVSALTLQLIAADPSHAQSYPDLSVSITAYSLQKNGGEKLEGVSGGTGPIEIGRTDRLTFSFADCGHLTASSADEYREHATAGWKIEITPLRVVDRAVTFRLRWVRSLDPNKTVTAPPLEDVEVTLRTGEKRPIDSVPVPRGAKTMDDSPCTVTSMLLKAGVDNWPREEMDRRLVAADLWLVERLSQGGERSQAQSVRGLPNRPVPFYFDSITDAGQSLDILGHLVPRPQTESVELSLQVRSRWGPSTFDWRNVAAGSTRIADSTIRMKPGEIVELPLPKLDSAAGPFANRVFVLRLRARQVR